VDKYIVGRPGASGQLEACRPRWAGIGDRRGLWVHHGGTEGTEGTLWVCLLSTSGSRGVSDRLSRSPSPDTTTRRIGEIPTAALSMAPTPRGSRWFTASCASWFPG